MGKCAFGHEHVINQADVSPEEWHAYLQWEIKVAASLLAQAMDAIRKRAEGAQDE